MDSSLIVWAVLAVSVFWSAGVYSRLARMRTRGLHALGSVEKHMRLYTNLVRGDVAQGAASDDWSRLLSALMEFEAALRDANAVAMRVESLARLGMAFDAVQAAWRTVDSAPPDLAGPTVPAALRSQWGTTSQRVETARGGFNQIVSQYNAALEQFPARLVVRMMGFEPGGLL